jgi:hypothetical protein
MSQFNRNASIGVEEDYYQISESVLSSFPKYRLPLDLFTIDAKVAQLVQYYKRDSRLSNEQVEEVTSLCREGNLFVSRKDHPIYAEHIIKQLDLVLVDENLKPGEVADIIIRALEVRLGDFFAQPVKPLFQPLYEDCMVFTEYMWADKPRSKMFMRRLYEGGHNLVRHSINTMMVGLWLFINDKGEGIVRKELDALALGLLLHDVGMSKVPPFILSKTTALKPDERDKIPPHVLAGMQVIQKMDLAAEETRAACLEHHERLDGSGYPQRLKALSVAGGIAAVADSFSAMLQKRVYAEAKDQKSAAQEISNDARYDRRFSGALFTAIVTDVFRA